MAEKKKVMLAGDRYPNFKSEVVKPFGNFKKGDEFVGKESTVKELIKKGYLK